MWQDMHAPVAFAPCQLRLTRLRKRGRGSPHEQETGRLGALAAFMTEPVRQ